MSNFKRIFLLRHAQALPADKFQNDFERQLSILGKNEASSIGELMARDYKNVEKVILSPSMRTTQTAEYLNLVKKENLNFISSLYDGTAADYLAALNQTKKFENVLLIGHNPAIFELLQFLVSPHSKIKKPITYPTATLAVIDFHNFQCNFSQQSGDLIAFHTP